MMFKSSNQIQIPNPCGENWDAMTVVEKGRFCGSCKTVVTDFSEMSDKEIIKYLSRNDKVCGRFRDDQLNRKLDDGKVNRGWLKWSIAASLGLGISHLSSAQSSTSEIVQSSPNKNFSKSNDIVCSINGRVIDTNGVALAFAHIAYSVREDSLDIRIDTYADSTGNFCLQIPDSLGNMKCSISASYIGHRSSIYLLENSSNRKIDFTLRQGASIITHTVGALPVSRKYRIRNKIRKFFTNIFGG